MNRTLIRNSECPPVEPVNNGVILGNSFELNLRRMVRCNPGYCEKTGQNRSEHNALFERELELYAGVCT
ncbi:hypothetical protein DPMN_054972 [Dreissena polymorpha]|uniref:Uncharacterized protein n=1 Tax=Dreissena polymorpha TaxID=45954 RepID=A0A9D4HRT6_DREPO|nr:hypothetical protein DPMN_054972 [Dreissena polymorpha]